MSELLVSVPDLELAQSWRCEKMGPWVGPKTGLVGYSMADPGKGVLGYKEWGVVHMASSTAELGASRGHFTPSC